MRVLVNLLSIVVISALTTGGVIYLNDQCPEKQKKDTAKIQETLELYLKQNPQVVLETLAKNENFGKTIKKFTDIDNSDMLKLVENYIKNNRELVAETVIRSDTYKNTVSKIQNTNSTPEKPQVSDENKKYVDHWDELANSDVAPFVGPKDAKVTIVEFFDFACGHCKALAPAMSRIIKQNPDVKFVFHPLYFISEHSPYAAKVSIAAFRKGKFAEVYEGILTLPNLNEEAINQILTDEGLDIDEIKAMIDEKEIRRGVQDIDSLSQVLGVNGVPMLLINGAPLGARSMEELQSIIDSYK